MSREEIDVTPYGEMVDLITCLSIFNGTAEQKRKLSYDEAIKLR